MTIEVLREMYERDLRTLRGEIEAYPDDEALWRVSEGITNSGGTLALHLAGNLQHFVGARLGATGYRRDREAEFARGGISRAELLAELDATSGAVSAALGGLSDARLLELFPDEFQGQRRTIGFMLAHLLGHLNYHIGQINYHRRLLAGAAER